MIGYIYITYNKVNGKIYIGQHKSKKYDKNYLGSGTLIKRAIEKYGVENFENHIIEWCNSKDELCKREIYWISKYNSFANTGIGYNLCKGGQFGDITFGMSEEQKELWKNKISQSSKGKKMSKEAKEKMSKSKLGNKSNTGRKFTDKHKTNISKALKNMSKQTRENRNKKFREKMLGHKVTEETKRKISESNKGKVVSNESKLKMSEKHKKKTRILYKEKEYTFSSGQEAVDYFKEMGMSIGLWRKRGVPKKYKNDFKFIENNTTKGEIL